MAGKPRKQMRPNFDVQELHRPVIGRWHSEKGYLKIITRCQNHIYCIKVKAPI